MKGRGRSNLTHQPDGSTGVANVWRSGISPECGRHHEPCHECIQGLTEARLQERGPRRLPPVRTLAHAQARNVSSPSTECTYRLVWLAGCRSAVARWRRFAVDGLA